MENAIESIPQMWSTLESAPQTLIHNDCNPRNIGLKKPTKLSTIEPTNPARNKCSTPSGQEKAHSTFVPYSNDLTLCIYDWELATIGVPQHDLAEFLAFVLQPNLSLQSRLEFIEFYRQHLQHYSGMEFPRER